MKSNAKIFCSVFAKPSSFIINSVSKSSISLSWKAPVLGGKANTITGYFVTVSPDESNPPDVQGTTANITGLTASKEYTINVAAMSSDERSGATFGTPTCTGKSYLKSSILNEFFNEVVAKRLLSSDTAAVFVLI